MNKCIFLFLIFALVNGCSTYHAAKLPSASVESYSNYQNQDGLKVALKFFDAEESKHFFGVEGLYEKCQPTYIIIKNDTDNVYFFEKGMLVGRAFLWWYIAGEAKNEAKVADTLNDFYLPVISPDAGIISLIDSTGTDAANTQLREECSNKEIKDGRIEANSSLSGVVFFEKIKLGERVTVRLQLIDPDEDAKAMEFYRKTASLAKAGDPEAMYQLALMYMDGHVVQKDYDKGSKWMAKAMQAGWVPPPPDPNRKITFSSMPTTWQQLSTWPAQLKLDMTNEKHEGFKLENIKDNTIKLFTFEK